jgi:hypothetical protein
MIKKIILLLVLQISIQSFSQVLYSERFNALSMNTETYTAGSSTQAYLYTDVPSGMTMINNGNLIADTLTGNYPFRKNGQKQKAWLVYKYPTIADTFAVSTSWLIPQGTADAWFVTPTISNIAANTVLTWEAMAPDLSNPDGYEVYVTTNVSSTPSTADFTINNRLFVTGAESGSWVAHGISLSAYAGQNIRLAFRNNSSNKYQLWIDDIIVKNLANSLDMGAVSGNIYKYSTINTNNSISASFKNNGSSPVTGLVLNYQVGSNPVVSQTQSFLNPLNYLEIGSYTFSMLYSSPTAGYNTVKVWVSSVNGQPDQFHANDTIITSLTLSNTIPPKKVLVEEFTSAKCAICPDGYTNLSGIVSTNTNVIATSIHSNDNASNATGNALAATFAPEGSSAMIDRYAYPGVGKITSGRNDWNTYITQRQTMVVPVSVSISGVSYNQLTRQISATVSADFVGDVKGDYRINLYIKENNIYGPIMDISDNGWNQYSSLFNIQASPYYQVGYTLNATTNILGPNQYSHQYVVDEFLDGPYGAAGIIPVNGSTAGQSYSKAYTYTLPMVFGGQYRYNQDNVYLVGIVSEYNTAVILNSVEVKLTSGPELPVGIAQLAKEDNVLNIYPNPASDHCSFSYSSSQKQEVKLQVYNMLGVLVYERSESVEQGSVIQQMDCSSLAEGNYQVVLSFKDHRVSKKLTVIK